MESIVSTGDTTVINGDIPCSACLSKKKFESWEVKYITFIFIIVCYILIRIV